MINFKNKDEALPSILILLSIVILLGSLFALMFLKPPSVAGMATEHRQKRNAIQKDITASEERARGAAPAARARLWRGDADTVTAAVLAQLTRQANQSAVQMVAFRPQKLQALEGIADLPFSVQLTGSYSKIRALVSVLDSSSSKLVLRSFQFASTDAASDAVTATVGISAYFTPPVSLEIAPAKGGKRG